MIYARLRCEKVEIRTSNKFWIAEKTGNYFIFKYRGHSFRCGKSIGTVSFLQ